MQEIIVGKNEAGQRFDKFLGKYFKEAGSGFIYKMLRKKNIELNGKKATGNEKLNTGDSVRIFMADDTIAKFRGISHTDTSVPEASSKSDISTKKDYETVAKLVIYEDENVLFLNKPAGILSQKATPKDISINEMIINYLIYKGELSAETMLTFKPSVCNRLDRNTTGLISFGKSLAGVQELSKGFKERTFDKYYITIVWGRITEKKIIEGYLKKDESQNKVKISKNGSDSSSYIMTQYEPLKHSTININGKQREITLLKIKLITGKTHQIRAHLSSIGHAILGDDKYGNLKDNAHLKKLYNIKYQLLHSYELHFHSLEDYEALKKLSHRLFTAEPAYIYNKLMVDTHTTH